MIITTESGTKYKIDLAKRTWERIEVTERSGPVRTVSGIYHEIRCHIGDRMRLFCPPFDPAMSGRLISTSPVVAIEPVLEAA